MPPPAPCVLGLAPHSGWAVAVIVGGSATQPRVLARARLELSDTRLAGSRQPYHHIEGMPLAQARAQLARLEASAAALAAGELTVIIARAQDGGAGVRAAAVLDSSGRTGASLEAILASHALIHTADGNHFRAALAQACEKLGIAVTRIRQRELPARAATALRTSPEELAAKVTALGREIGAPWGSDQKSAALIAWAVLAASG